MFDRIVIYRDVIVRAMFGTRPAIAAKGADETALARICAALVDAEDAKKLLCAKGYGAPWQSLADLVRALPEKAKP